MNPVVEAVRAEFPPFVEFRSIPRLFREMIVTEKLDGTNGLIEIHENGDVWAGSRSRYITPADDNYGFARWVADHLVELHDGLGVGRHFGEWWGQGIQRKYDLPEKRFSLFNVGRWWSPQHGDPTDKQTPPPACCSVVPILYRGEFDTERVRTITEQLRIVGSVAAPGFMKPEGVVAFHVHSNQLFKFTLDKNDGHKGGK